jgi:DNA-binding sugar fermentation-stimulating protein
MYGNDYDVATYMGDLTDAVFKTDLRKSVNTFRQQLQISYTELLIQALDPKTQYDRIARSVILAELKSIDRIERDAYSPDALTRAHRAHVRHLIDQAWKN